jgi:hypothetical protein
VQFLSLDLNELALLHYNINNIELGLNKKKGIKIANQQRQAIKLFRYISHMLPRQNLSQNSNLREEIRQGYNYTITGFLLAFFKRKAHFLYRKTVLNILITVKTAKFLEIFKIIETALLSRLQTDYYVVGLDPAFIVLMVYERYLLVLDHVVSPNHVVNLDHVVSLKHVVVIKVS